MKLSHTILSKTICVMFFLSKVANKTKTKGINIMIHGPKGRINNQL